MYDLYVKIRTWLQPYYVPKPKVEKIEKKSKVKTKKTSVNTKKKLIVDTEKNTKKVNSSKTKQKVSLQKKSSPTPKPKSKPKPKTLSLEERLELNLPLMEVVESTKPMHKVYEYKNKPKKKIWYYHDKEYHQVFVRLLPGQGFMATNRSDEDRKATRMIIFPNDQQYDRTHIIPFGYINTETDNRLIIGWNADMNRNALADFEKKQKYRKEPIYWFTQIRKTSYGAEWNAIILDEDGKIIDGLTLKLKARFIWLE